MNLEFVLSKCNSHLYLFIHRTRFRTEAGLLQLDLEVDGRAVRTWAYFELAR